MMLPPSLSSTLSFALPCSKNGFPYSLSILEHAPVLVWHAGSDGKCDWFNATWLTFTGRGLDEELGDGWAKGVHPDDLDACMRSYLEALEARRPFELEYRLRHHSGEYRWILDIGTPLFIEDGELSGYIGYCFDVTARKRAEHALAESEQRWQFALEGSRDGVWDWNVQTDEAYFSPRWKEMLGYQPEEIGASSAEWSSRVHPDDLHKVKEALEAHFRRETPFYLCEHRVRTKDGGYQSILTRGKVMTWTPDGRPLRTVGTHTDITYLKHLQELLIQSQIQFSYAFSRAPIGMALAGIDGRWLKVNPALCAILKYSEQELLNLNFQSVIHPDDVSNDVPQIIRLLNDDIQVYETEKRYLTKDGAVVWIQLNVALVGDAHGRPAYFIKQMQDITERKRAEEQLRQSEERFASFMDNLLGYAWIKDQAGAYVYANRKFLDVVARRMGPRFELLGSLDGEILPVEKAKICRENDLKVLRTGRPVETLEEFGLADRRRVLLVSKFPLKLGQDGETSVGGLGIDITARVRAEQALKRSRGRLRAALEERERLAQDLHDNSIQTLYAVGMDLCECKDLLAARSGKQKIGCVLDLAVDRINEVMRELRGHLRSKSLSQGKMPDDVAQAIRRMARQMSKSGNIRIKTTVQRRAIMALDQPHVAQVFAIMREGLSNIVRHAQARHAQVSLVLTQPVVCVEIADDGVGGAAVCQDRRTGQKRGLCNIRARAAKLKADYTLTSPQGGGTRIHLRIPVASDHGA